MNKQTDNLINRVVPLIDAIDMQKDFTPSLQGAVNSASVSGANISNLIIKLLILKNRDDINREEYLSLIHI